MNSKQYAYRVIWSEEDQEFVGLCAEFPSLSWLDNDQETALRGIVALVKDTVADMEARGEKIPAPPGFAKVFRQVPGPHHPGNAPPACHAGGRGGREPEQVHQ